MEKRNDERDEGTAAGEAGPQKPLPPAWTEGRRGRSPYAEAQASHQTRLKTLSFLASGFRIIWCIGSRINIPRQNFSNRAAPLTAPFFIRHAA
jgi:hypothetical protein